MRYIKSFNENFIHEPFPSLEELKDYLLPIEDESIVTMTLNNYIKFFDGEIEQYDLHDNEESIPTGMTFCGITFTFITELVKSDVEKTLIENIFFNILNEYPNLHLYYRIMYNDPTQIRLDITIMDRLINTKVNKAYINFTKYNSELVKENKQELNLPSVKELNDYFLSLIDESTRYEIYDALNNGSHGGIALKPYNERNPQNDFFNSINKEDRRIGLFYLFHTTLDKNEAINLLEDNILFNIQTDYPDAHIYYHYNTNNYDEKENTHTISVTILNREVSIEKNSSFTNDTKYKLNESADNLFPSDEELNDYLQILTDESSKNQTLNNYLSKDGSTYTVSEVTRNVNFCGKTFLFNLNISQEELEALLISNVFYNIHNDYPNLHLYCYRNNNKTGLVSVSILNIEIDIKVDRKFINDLKYENGSLLEVDIYQRYTKKYRI